MDFRAKPEIMALGGTEQFKRGVIVVDMSWAPYFHFLHFSNAFLKVIIPLQSHMSCTEIASWNGGIKHLFYSIASSLLHNFLPSYRVSKISKFSAV